MSDVLTRIEGLLLVERDFFLVYAITDITPNERTILAALVADTYVNRCAYSYMERLTDLTGFSEAEIGKIARKGGGYFHVSPGRVHVGTRFFDLGIKGA